jgi:hypothetical protein
MLMVCFVNYRFMMYKETCYPGDVWEWGYFGRELAETFFGALPKNDYR